VRGTRRFSQALAEGDGISLLASVGDVDEARRAEADGARGLVVTGTFERTATELPVLWRGPGAADDARQAEADAYLVVVGDLGDDDGRLELLHRDVVELGLDCVVETRSEEELERALEQVDPEIFLLSARGDLERVLELLPDVPAGKLAIADGAGASAEDVAELERAGFDAVIVAAGDLGALAGGRRS
jgi:indole-3-glycerol phosphate synthase